MPDDALTSDERAKFAAFLEKSAAETRRRIVELENRGGMELRIQKLKVEAISELMVARKLRAPGPEPAE